MNLLITGGLGFIGSNFVNYITANSDHTVCCVIDKCTYASDRNRISKDIKLIKKDINDVNWLSIFKKYRVNTIVNFAASTHVDRSIESSDEFIYSNYVGVHKILQGIRECNHAGKNVFFVQISTDEVYSDLPINNICDSFREDDKLLPNNPYSSTKASADLLIRAFYHTYKDFDYTICRASNNYGINQHREKFIPMCIINLLEGKPITLYGKGENVREWLWAEDFCEGIVRVLDLYQTDKKKLIIGNIFNFGSGIRVSNKTVAEYILKIMNRSKEEIVYVEDRPGHDRKYAIDSTKARIRLNWQSKKIFKEGLREVYQDLARK